MLTRHTERLHLHLYFITYNAVHGRENLANFLAMASLPKGPAACCIGSLLLLGPLLDPLKICRPHAVSRKTEILSATFLISRPRETPQDCKETHMFSVSSKPLSLKDSPFFFLKNLLRVAPNISQLPGPCAHRGLTQNRKQRRSLQDSLWNVNLQQIFFGKNAIFSSPRSSYSRDFTPGLMQYFAVSRGALREKVALRI